MPSKKRGVMSKREFEKKSPTGSYSKGYKVGMPRKMVNLKGMRRNKTITSLD